MTAELDDMPFGADAGETVLAPPKAPHRHRWVRWTIDDNGVVTHRVVCESHAVPVVRDEARARRGKSSRRLGGDQERRIERRFGPTKIGERGDPVDHLGRVWRWQAKATRSLPPRWLATIDAPRPLVALPLALSRAHAAMDGHYGARCSVVIRSFVRTGVPVRDWLFISAIDAMRELALLAPPDTPWWVVPGDWFLDHFGRDE